MKVYILCFLIAGVVSVQPESSPHEKYLKEAADVIEASVKKFQEWTGIQTEFDKSKLESFLKTTFGKTAEKIQDLYKNLEKDGKPFAEDVKKNIENIVKQFNETVKNINTPEVQGKLQKINEQVVQSAKKLREQAAELGKALGVAVPANIQKGIDDIIEEISKAGHKVQEKFNQIVADAQAELKKKQKA